MAVYTAVPAEALDAFAARFGIGAVRLFKGIAEGVENSNFLLETERGRYFLTLYEKRVSADDLPYFLKLLDHLHARGLPVPRAIPDLGGRAIHELEGRPACLIEFLTGVSPTRPSPAQARATGEALGRLHRALADFGRVRPNALGVGAWRPLLERCGRDADLVAPGLYDRVDAALARIEADWPRDLPVATIHADLFPDNVLMLDERVTGLIDFYFACSDVRAYDLAITHSSWAFDTGGVPLDRDVGAALIDGYERAFGLTGAERAALPVLARGACVRFLLTRLWDWLDTPADALVTRKDPLAYLRRLEWYERERFVD